MPMFVRLLPRSGDVEILARSAAKVETLLKLIIFTQSFVFDINQKLRIRVGIFDFMEKLKSAQQI